MSEPEEFHAPPDPSLGKETKDENKSLVSLDVYGVKADVEPGPGDENPDSWSSVWEHVHRHLRRAAVSVVGLPADLLGAARSLCQAIPRIPNAIATRLFRGRVLAQAREEAKQLKAPREKTALPVSVPTSQSRALADLRHQLDLLKAEGYYAELQRHGDGFVLVLVPPDKKEQAKVLGHAALEQATPIHPTPDQISVEVLPLSRRIREALAAAEIETAEQLSEHTESQLLAVPGVGPAAMRDIRIALARFELTIASDPGIGE